MSRSVKQLVERVFYKYGLFASKQPKLMLFLTTAVLFICGYTPLLNLPLPGNEPRKFYTRLSQNVTTTSSQAELPEWLDTSSPAAYVQQIVVKSTVRPWPGDAASQAHAFKSTFDGNFKLLDFLLRRFTYENATVFDSCYRINDGEAPSSGGVKSNNLFSPVRGCLVVSPALYWEGKQAVFNSDENVKRTILKYSGKLNTPPSVEELLFGVPADLNGVKLYNRKKNTVKNVITYAVTLVLNSGDVGLHEALRRELHREYGVPVLTSQAQRCWQQNAAAADEKGADDDTMTTATTTTSCQNVTDTVTHIHYTYQRSWSELVRLVALYVILGSYIYFSVRKIDFLKSKLGMAFLTVATIISSLIMSVGLCVYFGLSPENHMAIPYVLCLNSVQNLLAITRSVVNTENEHGVEERVAVGLGCEGYATVTNLLQQAAMVTAVIFLGAPHVRETFAFFLIAIFSEFLLHMILFVPVLSIDVRRRLDLPHHYHHHHHHQQHHHHFNNQQEEEDEVKLYQRVDNATVQGPASQQTFNRQYSQLNHHHHRHHSSSRDHHISPSAHIMEMASLSKRITFLSKRLKFLFFIVDYRLIQRGLQLAIACYYVLGPNTITAATPHPPHHDVGTLRRHDLTTGGGGIGGHAYADVVFSYPDLTSAELLSHRHWPTLFAYYNRSLNNRYISLMPPILLPVINDGLMYNKLNDDKTAAAADNSDVTADSYVVRLSENNAGGGVRVRATLPEDETQLQYYFTLLVGAVCGIFMFMVLQYCLTKCCSGYWHYGSSGKYGRNGAKRSRNYETLGFEGADAYSSASGGACVPITLTGHAHQVDLVSVDQVTVASVDYGGELRCWDIHSGDVTCTMPRKLRGPDDDGGNKMKAAAADAEEHQYHQIVNSGDQQQPRQRRHRDNSRKRSLDSSSRSHLKQRPPVWALLAKEQLVFTGCEDGSIEIWDSASGCLKGFHDLQRPGVVHLVMCDVTARLVCARINGTIDFFDLEVLAAADDGGDDDASTSVQYRGANKNAATAASLTSSQPLLKSICCHHDKLQLVQRHTVRSAHQQTITCLLANGHGRLITGSCDHTLKIFNVETAACEQTLYGGHEGAVTCVHISDHVTSSSGKKKDEKPMLLASQQLMSGAEDGSVCVWRAGAGAGDVKLLEHPDMQLLEHQGAVVVICSNMHVVLTTGDDDVICVWSREHGGELLRTMKLESGCALANCLLNDSSVTCVSGGHGKIFLWNLADGKVMRTCKVGGATLPVLPPVRRLVSLAHRNNLTVLCVVGRDMYIVWLPSVLVEADRGSD